MLLLRQDMEAKMRDDLKKEQRQKHAMLKRHQGEIEKLGAANKHAEAEVCEAVEIPCICFLQIRRAAQSPASELQLL